MMTNTSTDISYLADSLYNELGNKHIKKEKKKKTLVNNKEDDECAELVMIQQNNTRLSLTTSTGSRSFIEDPVARTLMNTQDDELPRFISKIKI